MTKRAILYCGQVRQPALRRDLRGNPSRLRGSLLEVDDEHVGTDDSKIQCNSLELSFNSALALGVDRTEIYACVFNDDLLPPSFDSRNNHPATVAGLRHLVRSLSARARPEDALLFIAVNHADETALVTADPVDELAEESTAPRLTPAALDDCLGALPGSQVIVVATCHAGIFLALSERPDRAILVACAAGDEHLIARKGCAWSSFLDELFGAWCECAFSDAIPRKRLPLHEAFGTAHTRLTEGRASALPLSVGAAEWPA